MESNFRNNGGTEMIICRTCLGCNLLEDKNFKGKDKCEYYVYDSSMDSTTFISNNNGSTKPNIISDRLNGLNR